MSEARWEIKPDQFGSNKQPEPVWIGDRVIHRHKAYGYGTVVARQGHDQWMVRFTGAPLGMTCSETDLKHIGTPTTMTLVTWIGTPLVLLPSILLGPCVMALAVTLATLMIVIWSTEYTRWTQKRIHARAARAQADQIYRTEVTHG